MTKAEFIEQIAGYVKKYAPLYGVKVYSPIIAQASLESAYGTSELAQAVNNVLGIKYWAEISDGAAYTKVGSEQKADGTYVSSVMQWCSFNSIERGVEGYFQFLFKRKGVTRYNGLVGITEPREYLQTIWDAHYATSLDYVDNVMRVIESNNLTIYDKEEIMATSSPLASYISLKSTRSRNGKTVKYILPHCYVGHCTGKSGVDAFNRRTDSASVNYVIGDTLWDIGQQVDEELKPGTTGGDKTLKTPYGSFIGNAIDYESITFEIACDDTAPYGITEGAKANTINLMAEIAKRRGLYPLKWKADPQLVGNPSEQNVLVHRWFASKSCPGDAIYSMLGEIVREANKVVETGKWYVPSSVNVARPTLRKGSKGAEVKLLQQNLMAAGFSLPKYGADGDYGNETYNAVLQLQKKAFPNNSKEWDGIYGSKTCAKLTEMLK